MAKTDNPTEEIDDETSFCKTCKITKPVSEFTIDKRYAVHKPKARCKDCIAAYFRHSYYERHKKTVLRKNEVYRRNNWERLKRLAYKRTDPVKASANHAVNYAISKGEFSKQPCQVCGEEKADFHHTDGYDKENWFTGVWLCRPHHAEEHRRLRWQTT